MTKTILAATTALIALGSLSMAQEGPSDVAPNAAIYQAIPSVTDSPAPAVSEFVTGQAKGQLLSTDFLGLPVEDAKGAQLGTIDDVMFDENGKLSVIILNVGDLVGTDKRIAFDLGDLRRSDKGSVAHLVANIDRAAIGEAPNFTSLAEEMQLNDGQSLTEGEAEGAVQQVPAN